MKYQADKYDDPMLRVDGNGIFSFEDKRQNILDKKVFKEAATKGFHSCTSTHQHPPFPLPYVQYPRFSNTFPRCLLWDTRLTLRTLPTIHHLLSGFSLP